MRRARSRSRERAIPADIKPYGGGGAGAHGMHMARDVKPSALALAPTGASSAAAATAAATAAAAPPGPVEQANFGLSGALARDAATGNAAPSGVALKFVQPPEARLPTRRWRFYVFKGASAEPLETLHLHRASAYLFGRDAAAADVHLEHPSISKQHAVLQFRGVPAPREEGDMRPPEQRVLPYLMDLESANGSFLNDAQLEGARYVELRAGDRVRFGGSTREYVLVVEDK